MHTVSRWRWRILDPDRGRRYTPRCHMTEADALALDPTAERVDGTLQLLELPDSPAEHQSTSAWRAEPPAAG